MNTWLQFMDRHIAKLPVWLVNVLGLCVVAVVGIVWRLCDLRDQTAP
jgi:hypothetical protein